MTVEQAALFIAFVVAATLAQGLTGFAFVLVLLGLCGLFELAPLADLTNVATTLSVMSAAPILRASRRNLDRAAYRDALAGLTVGVIAGVVLLGWLSANVVTGLRVLLGVTVCACAIAMLRPANVLPARSSAMSFRGFGFLSGLLGGLFSAGGPPLVYHFYRQPLAMDALRATLLAALTTMSAIRIVAVLATGQFSLLALELSLFAAPVVMAVSWLLRRHPPGWPRKTVLKLVCVLLFATGIGIVVSAMSGVRASGNAAQRPQHIGNDPPGRHGASARRDGAESRRGSPLLELPAGSGTQTRSDQEIT